MAVAVSGGDTKAKTECRGLDESCGLPAIMVVSSRALCIEQADFDPPLGNRLQKPTGYWAASLYVHELRRVPVHSASNRCLIAPASRAVDGTIYCAVPGKPTTIPWPAQVQPGEVARVQAIERR